MSTDGDPLRGMRARIHPKLQMIANGSKRVNIVRSEHASAVWFKENKIPETVQEIRGAGNVPGSKSVVRVGKRRGLASLPKDVMTNVFIFLKDGKQVKNGARENFPQFRNVLRARLPLTKLPVLLKKDKRIAYIEPGEGLRAPIPIVAKTRIEQPESPIRDSSQEFTHKNGAGVLIGIIDVGGFDFSHPDFLKYDKRSKPIGTRFMRIWDQGGDTRPPPSRSNPTNVRFKKFTYGAEFDKADLNVAIKKADKIGLPAYEIEHQSQMSECSHGTHVASIAAGNHGICPKADIAGVLISLDQLERDRRLTFCDSTCLADAVDYLVALAEDKGRRLSINISLGTNGHAHDGSSAICRWFDNVLSVPGRAITIAAGNAGQEKAESPDDTGWMMGRIHSSGKIPATGLSNDIWWEVPGNLERDMSENELEIWYSSNDRFAVSIRPPGEKEWVGKVAPHQFIENRRLRNGSYLSIYNQLYHPSNGSNLIAIYLSPNLDTKPVIGVKAGTWLVRITGEQIRDGGYHAWIERDDPRPIGMQEEKELWAFPSFFSKRSAVDDTTVNPLGCGHSILTVSNYDEEHDMIHITSSQGPTRDGRCKPDIAAPGTNIVAAKGFSTSDDRWIEMTGTSMASPYVTGVAGLMLAINPNLTASQIDGIMRSTAKPLPGTNYSWKNDMGFGVLEPEKCFQEALSLLSEAKDIEK